VGCSNFSSKKQHALNRLTVTLCDVLRWEITWRQIEHFFSHYKDLEVGKWTAFAGWGGASEAKRLITEAIDRSKNKGTKEA
jgi:hypothetical protein